MNEKVMLTSMLGLLCLIGQISLATDAKSLGQLQKLKTVNCFIQNWISLRYTGMKYERDEE